MGTDSSTTTSTSTSTTTSTSTSTTSSTSAPTTTYRNAYESPHYSSYVWTIISRMPDSSTTSPFPKYYFTKNNSLSTVDLGYRFMILPSTSSTSCVILVKKISTTADTSVINADTSYILNTDYNPMNVPPNNYYLLIINNSVTIATEYSGTLTSDFVWGLNNIFNTISSTGNQYFFDPASPNNISTSGKYLEIIPDPNIPPKGTFIGCFKTTPNAIVDPTSSFEAGTDSEYNKCSRKAQTFGKNTFGIQNNICYMTNNLDAIVNNGRSNECTFNDGLVVGNANSVGVYSMTNYSLLNYYKDAQSVCNNLSCYSTNTASKPTTKECANENGTCTLPAGINTIYYGAGSSFKTIKTINGNGYSIPCGSSTFGDPSPGVTKTCSYEVLNTPLCNNTSYKAILDPTDNTYKCMLKNFIKGDNACPSMYAYDATDRTCTLKPCDPNSWVDTSTSDYCVPICDSNCINCIAPGVCALCNPGYNVDQTGKCYGSVNGTLVIPEKTLVIYD